LHNELTVYRRVIRFFTGIFDKVLRRGAGWWVSAPFREAGPITIPLPSEDPLARSAAGTLKQAGPCWSGLHWGRSATLCIAVMLVVKLAMALCARRILMPFVGLLAAFFQGQAFPAGRQRRSLRF
jgi:hypothetical protein